MHDVQGVTSMLLPGSPCSLLALHLFSCLHSPLGIQPHVPIPDHMGRPRGSVLTDIRSQAPQQPGSTCELGSLQLTQPQPESPS